VTHLHYSRNSLGKYPPVMADDLANRNDLERQSSSESYQSIGETERQTANWMEVRIIGSGGFGNVTLWKNKVIECVHVSVYVPCCTCTVGVACTSILPNKDISVTIYSMMVLIWSSRNAVYQHTCCEAWRKGGTMRLTCSPN